MHLTPARSTVRSLCVQGVKSFCDWTLPCLWQSLWNPEDRQLSVRRVQFCPQKYELEEASRLSCDCVRPSEMLVLALQLVGLLRLEEGLLDLAGWCRADPRT